MGFMKNLEKNEKKLTENGAVGFKTEGHKIVDLNFAIPSFRCDVDTELFEQSLKEDRNLTLKWLLFLRDVRGGVGERKSFRDFMVYLSNKHSDIAVKMFENIDIAEYGRWDDILDIYFRTDSKVVKSVIKAKVIDQFVEDVKNLKDEKPVSLLGKWLYSENASSNETKVRAKVIRKWFTLSSKEYRKVLSKLRKHIDVVETKTSSNRWSEIDYATVPSKANIKYADAFYKHDSQRRLEYLNSLAKGETKINANALFLHDIVEKYHIQYDYDIHNASLNPTLEAMWNAQTKLEGFENTLVVCDGSGSMTCRIGNTTALTVARSIALYCAQNNTGEFKNKFITFSANPEIVTVDDDTLFDNLCTMAHYDDCSNTNIEKTFDLILETAVKHHMPQEEMPKSVLIISDMEFDGLASGSRLDKTPKFDIALFESIAERFKEYGYVLPKLVFWNVNSRRNAIPLTENEMGVILLSGFSKNLMTMVMSSETSPYNALVKQLNVPRYEVIDEVFK